ncbi:MAG: SSU ribosomal protein S6p, partial [uncultured Acetobacteraceae bacterium]
AALRMRAHRAQRRHATAGRGHRRPGRRHGGRAGGRGPQARVLGPARPRLQDQEEPQGALHAPRHRRAAGRRAGSAAPARPARGRAARDDAPGGGHRRGALGDPVPPQRGAGPRPRLPRPAPGRPLRLRPRPRAERRARGIPRPPARGDRHPGPGRGGV